jgi:hypothetical protein
VTGDSNNGARNVFFVNLLRGAQWVHSRGKPRLSSALCPNIYHIP